MESHHSSVTSPEISQVSQVKDSNGDYIFFYILKIATINFTCYLLKVSAFTFRGGATGVARGAAAPLSFSKKEKPERNKKRGKKSRKK